jgi:hypothetical protein
MKKIIPTIIIIALVAWGVYYFTIRSTSSLRGPGSLTATSSEMQTYTNDPYGISFMYPKNYKISEGEKGAKEQSHYAIVIVRDEDRVPPVNGEGPTAITFDIYRNATDTPSIDQWLNNSVASNYNLSKGTYATTTIAFVPAITYDWSGLYEGRTIAFLHHKNIVALSVTYLSADDQNLGVYDIIRTSLKLR